MKNDLEKWRSYVEIFSNGYNYGIELSSSLINKNKKDVEFPFINPDQIYDNSSKYETERSNLNNKSTYNVIICSPHPDDECLTGALPLRLLQENNANVLNLAFTLGSDETRRKERLKELNRACEVVGFENRLIKTPDSFNDVSVPEGASNNKKWQKKIDILLSHFQDYKPDLVIFPHSKDGHPTHVSVNLLVDEALKKHSNYSNCKILGVNSEFWHPMESPQMLVGITSNDLALLVTGVSKHYGEINRNPYHLSMPARMMDNVRRGGELVCGRNASLSSFCFGELYNLSLFVNGEREEYTDRSLIFPPEVKINF